MIGSDGPPRPAVAAVTDQTDEFPWWRHDNGRWVVGDAGRQPETVVVPSTSVAADRPDTVVDGGQVGGVTFRAVSLRGLKHQETGTPRQDSYLVRSTMDGRWLVGCVADGVSEGRRSHEAADLVCREFVQTLVRALTDLGADPDTGHWSELVQRLPWQPATGRANAAVVEAAKAAARAAYEKRSDRRQLALLEEKPYTEGDARRVMSSTAVAFVIGTEPVADEGYPAAVAVVAGDSSAMAFVDRSWLPLTAVKNNGAEVHSSIVEPLPRAVTVVPGEFWVRPGDGLLVMTDGLGDPMGLGQGVVGSFLAARWAEAPDLLAFAQDAAFYRKTFADDRTAVMIWAGRRAGKHD